MRVPFRVQGWLKTAFPSLPVTYRHTREKWRHGRSYYARSPFRFSALVRQMSETPFPRLQEEHFRQQLARNDAGHNDVSNAVIEINNTCNIDCLMCMTSQSTRQKGRMTSDMLKRAVERTTERGTRDVELHTLGDPLANPRIADVFALLRQHKLRTGISTNGLMLHRHVDTLIEFVDVCSSLSFSIDGATAPTYERIRAGGNWDRLLANLDLSRERLKPHGFRIRSAMVVSRDNAHEVGQYIVQLRDYVTHPPLDITFGVVNSLAPDNKYFEATNLFPIHTHLNTPCHMVSNLLPHMLVDGRVSVCSRDYDGSLVVGDFRQDSLSDIMGGTPIRTLQRAHTTGDVSAFPMCSTCFAVDYRISSALNELSGYLLYFFPQAKAEFYQQRIDACIAMFQKGADPTIAAALFPTPQSGDQSTN